MKNARLVGLILLLVSTSTLGQSLSEMMDEIKGQWKTDSNGHVTYQYVVEVPGVSRYEIFNRARNYIVYNYTGDKSTIDVQDTAAGLIVARGLFKEIHFGQNLGGQFYIDTWHVIRVDTKPGKARITITLTDYEKKIVGSHVLYTSSKVESEYPVNPNATETRVIMGKAFYYSHRRVLKEFQAIMKAIQEGNTSTSIEGSDW